MCLIEWNLSFYTGLPDVDEQHKRLVMLANRLGAASDSNPELLDEAFGALNAYVAEHFSLEERLMDEADIDREHVAAHKAAHARFVEEVAELWRSRSDGTEKTIQEMLIFLRSWIRQHILKTDGAMAHRIHDKLGTSAPHNMFSHF